MDKVDKAVKVATIIFNIVATITFIVLLIDLWASHSTGRPVALITAVGLTIATCYAVISKIIRSNEFR